MFNIMNFMKEEKFVLTATLLLLLSAGFGDIVNGRLSSYIYFVDVGLTIGLWVMVLERRRQVISNV